MNVFRSNILAMKAYVPGEQPPPGKFIKLNTNENPYPPSPKVVAAIRHTLDLGLQRYPDSLASAFRMRAAQVLGLTEEHLLCGNGSDELLTIVVRALVPEGGLVRFLTPSYLLYQTICEIQNCRTEVLNYLPDWSLPQSFLRPDPELRLAILANPNSPSGTLASPDLVAEIVDSLPCPLLVDEAYVEFARWDCLDLARSGRRVIVTRSLSKSYALAGLRFGYLVAPPEWIEQFRKLKDSYNCDSLAIAGATAAIDDQAWLQETRAKILRTRESMREQLLNLGLQVPESDANFVWCTCPGRPLQPVYEALKARQILVRYMAYPGWEEGLRISVGTDDQISALLTTLKSIW